MERLYEIAAKHLHFVFQAYPGFEQYRKSIFKGFLRYISNGVTQENLCELFGCKNIEVLNQVTGISKTEIKKNFINYGFAEQYGCSAANKEKDFYTTLLEKVEVILVTYNLPYLFDIHPEYEEIGSPMSTLKDETIPNLFREYSCEFLYSIFLQNKNFNELGSTKINLLGIQKEQFENSFKKKIIAWLEKNVKNDFPICAVYKKLLTQLQLNNNDFYQILFSYGKDINVDKVIKSSIENAYNDLCEFSINKKTKEDLRKMRLEVKQLRQSLNPNVLEKLGYALGNTGFSNSSEDEDFSLKKEDTNLSNQNKL